MQLTDLIKNATDILASQGNISVDIELDNDRYCANNIEIQSRNSTSQETIAVIYASSKNSDNYK